MIFQKLKRIRPLGRKNSAIRDRPARDMWELLCAACINSQEIDTTELASALIQASPDHAKLFALSMHEQLCEQGDFVHADIWQEILSAMDKVKKAV